VGIGKDGTGDRRTAGTWGVNVNSSRGELESAGYIAVYRGTNASGIDEVRLSKTGVMGEGIYFYTDPVAAASYAESGGGIVAAYVNPEEGAKIDDVPGRDYRLVKVTDKGTIIRRGTIPTEKTRNKDELIAEASQALDIVWTGYKYLAKQKVAERKLT